jgi:Glycosyl transferase family 2
MVAMTAAWGPIKVSVIDVERCPEGIGGAPDDTALWALVREHRRPRGMIKLPFADGRIAAGALSRAIAELPPAAAAPPLVTPLGVRLPPVSVVIPSVLERVDGIRACLDSVAALDYPDFEVIVVDNRRAGSAPVELEGVRVVREPRPGISAARNRGLEAADGEIVAFTDDDVIVDPEWLLAIALRFRDHPDEACVTGLALPGELETPAQVALEEYYGGFGPRTFTPVSHRLRHAAGLRSLLRPATVDAFADDGRLVRSFSLYAAGSFGPGANMAFRAQVLRELDGFDLALGAGTPARGGEDLVMFARMAWHGHSVGFEPAATVHHSHRRGDDALQRQIEGYGVGYGALLLALVLEDPRHLGRMLGTVPRGILALRGDYQSKLDTREHPDPRTQELARLELRGMLAGPAAYLRSRFRWSP